LILDYERNLAAKSNLSGVANASQALTSLNTVGINFSDVMKLASITPHDLGGVVKASRALTSLNTVGINFSDVMKLASITPHDLGGVVKASRGLSSITGAGINDAGVMKASSRLATSITQQDLGGVVKASQAFASITAVGFGDAGVMKASSRLAAAIQGNLGGVIKASEAFASITTAGIDFSSAMQATYPMATKIYKDVGSVIKAGQTLATSVPAGIDPSRLIGATTPLFVQAQAQASLSQLSKASKAFMTSIPAGLNVSGLVSAAIPVESSLRSNLALLSSSNPSLIESVAAKINAHAMLADIGSNFDFPRLFTPGIRHDAVVNAVSPAFMMDFLNGFGGAFENRSGTETQFDIESDHSRTDNPQAATSQYAENIETAVEVVGLLLLAFCVLYPTMAAVCLSGVETIVTTGVSIVDAIGSLFQHSDFLSGLAAIGFIGGTGAYVYRKTSKGSDAESRDEEAEK
jgi:hypothetical protein